ncbi:MAG TPA: dephospho-CoA kinase [Burkholderiales bacterium]|nr:dephospho-CoA kinase [Burkholderiales bacterium]
MAFNVGLTGGIGSGKSRAADIFAELGAAVIDTDAISHELTRPGGAAMEPIRHAFGAEYVHADGSLDRPRMRSRVFSDPEARRALEAILHPLIREAVRAGIAAAKAPYVMLVVPLLLETGSYRDLLDRIVVVDCDESQQISRTMARSRLAEDEVKRIMDAQIPRADRVRAADDVIANDGDINQLRERVAALHRTYLDAASSA